MKLPHLATWASLASLTLLDACSCANARAYVESDSHAELGAYSRADV